MLLKAHWAHRFCNPIHWYSGSISSLLTYRMIQKLLSSHDLRDLRNRRLRSAALVVAVSIFVFGGLSAASYCVGIRSNPDSCFLDPNRAPTRDEANVAQLVNYALRSDEANVAIFIGDSACAAGINPNALSFPAWNLASCRGFGPAGFSLITKAYLKGHPRPGAIILVATPFCFEVDPSTLGSGEYADRIAAAYGPEVGGSEVLRIAFIAKRGAVSLLRSTDVRDMPLIGLEQETCRTYEAKMRKSRGFHFLPAIRGKGQGVPWERPEIPVHPDWDSGIRSIADACKECGVPLLIRFAPIDSAVRAARDWSQLERWASELEGSQPNVTVARPIVLAYEPRFMWDAMHLNAAGVEKFMPVVAKDVQAVLGN